MITDPYDLDTVEEAFDVALRWDLTFKTLVNAKVWCSKCEEYEHYDYQCSSESQHVNDSKVVEDVQVSPKIVNIIEDIAVDSDTLIIDEIHMSSDNANDDQCFKYQISAIYRSTKLYTGYRIPDGISRYGTKYRLIYQ